MSPALLKEGHVHRIQPCSQSPGAPLRTLWDGAGSSPAPSKHQSSAFHPEARHRESGLSPGPQGHRTQEWWGQPALTPGLQGGSQQKGAERTGRTSSMKQGPTPRRNWGGKRHRRTVSGTRLKHCQVILRARTETYWARSL